MPISAARLQQARTHWPIVLVLTLMGLVIGFAGIYYVSRLLNLEGELSNRDTYLQSQQQIKEAYLNALSSAPTIAPNPDRPVPTNDGFRLEYSLSENETSYVYICAQCQQHVIQWQDWLMYPIKRVQKNRNRGFVELRWQVDALNLSSKEIVTLLSADDITNFIEPTTFLGSVNRLEVLEDQLYISIGDYYMAGLLLRVDLLDETATPELVYYDTTNPGTPRLSNSFGRWWVSTGFGDGCGGSGTLNFLSLETGQTQRFLNTAYGCVPGDSVVTKLDDDTLLVSTHENAQIDSPRTYGQVFTSLDTISMNPPFERTTILTSTDFPEPVTNIWYEKRLDAIVLDSPSTMYQFDPRDASIVDIGIVTQAQPEQQDLPTKGLDAILLPNDFTVVSLD